MPKIRVGICDDEKFWIEQTEKYLLKYSRNYQKNFEIKIFHSAEEYLQKEERIDILLLDIMMDKLSGIDLKNLLTQKLKEESIIFISSYSGLMNEAFGKNVYGFLDKPIIEKKLFEKLNVIIEEKERIIKISLGGDTFLYSSDIIYVRAINKYVEICTGIGVHIGYFSLKECEKKLPSSGFRRVQRSFIVNYDHVINIKSFIEMDNGFKVPVRRGMIIEIKEEHFEYIRKKMRD